MNFRIADTFADSLAHLNGDEQKAAKATALDLQLNPSNPGMSFNKLERPLAYPWERWSVFLYPAQQQCGWNAITRLQRFGAHYFCRYPALAE